MIEETFPINSGSKLLLKYCFKSLPTENYLYHVELETVDSIKRREDPVPFDENILYIVNGWINIEAPFYRENIKLLAKREFNNIYVKLLTVMMLSEAFAKIKGDETEHYFRSSFNALIYT